MLVEKCRTVVLDMKRRAWKILLSVLLGMAAGAALGAVVWAIVLSFGYIASLVGLLIGFLAEKGYSLCKGRQGKGKIAILILAVVFGVVLGTFIGVGVLKGSPVGPLIGSGMAVAAISLARMLFHF